MMFDIHSLSGCSARNRVGHDDYKSADIALSWETQYISAKCRVIYDIRCISVLIKIHASYPRKKICILLKIRRTWTIFSNTT